MRLGRRFAIREHPPKCAGPARPARWPWAAPRFCPHRARTVDRNRDKKDGARHPHRDGVSSPPGCSIQSDCTHGSGGYFHPSGGLRWACSKSHGPDSSVPRQGGDAVRAASGRVRPTSVRSARSVQRARFRSLSRRCPLLIHFEDLASQLPHFRTPEQMYATYDGFSRACAHSARGTAR